MRTLQQLRDLISRHSGESCAASVRGTALPRLGLLRCDRPTLPFHTIYEPMLCIVAQGRKRAVLGEGVYDYDASTFLLVSVDLPVSSAVIEASTDAPYLALGLTLDRAILAELILQMPPPATAHADTPAMTVCALSDALLDAAVRLLQVLDQPQDAAVLAPLIEREILYHLLTGPRGAWLRQMIAGDAVGGRIANAIAWIRSHYRQPLRIAELSERVNMTPSSLHRHFKAVTAMSPLQYQKHIRLQEARRLLLSEADDAASVGFRIGYESASQFSREYSRHFGAPPLRDVARLREAGVVLPSRLQF